MINLDTFRSIYIKIPSNIRNNISPLLSLIPIKYRYGKKYTYFRNIIENSRNNYQFVEEWQKIKIREKIQTALKTNYYKNFIQNSKILIDFNKFTYNDLIYFPILNKETYRERPLDFLDADKSCFDLISTSGSSGNPLFFYLEKSRSPIEWAFIQNTWSSLGYNPKFIRGVFRGLLFHDIDNKPYEFDPALSEYRFSPFHLTEKWMKKYCEIIELHKIKYLHGYPSALYIFTQYISRNSLNKIQNSILGIFPISESLFSHQRLMLNKTFPNAKILSYYGMSEKVLFAAEDLNNENTYEFNPLYGIAELVDNNGKQIFEKGKKGKLIGTGLLYSGTCFIRYDTGDFAELVEQATPDNGLKLRVKNIRSRWGQEFLVGKNGELISMTAINIHSKEYSYLLEFQFFQNAPGFAILKYVKAPGSSEDNINSFLNEISSKIGHSIHFTKECVKSINRNSRGKSKFIDQKILI